MGVRVGEPYIGGVASARVGAVLCLALAGLAPSAAAAQAASGCRGKHWLGAWSASPAFAQDRVLEDQTLRLVVNPTTGGRIVRVHISNRFGTAPLRIGQVTIARRASGAALVAGTVRTLRFGGRRSATLAAGADAVSDAARLRVKAFGDLAVSIHVTRLSGGVTFHPFAFQTSYEGAGSHAADRGGAAFTETTRAWPPALRRGRARPAASRSRRGLRGLLGRRHRVADGRQPPLHRLPGAPAGPEPRSAPVGAEPGHRGKPAARGRELGLRPEPGAPRPQGRAAPAGRERRDRLARLGQRLPDPARRVPDGR